MKKEIKKEEVVKEMIGFKTDFNKLIKAAQEALYCMGRESDHKAKVNLQEALRPFTGKD